MLARAFRRVLLIAAEALQPLPRGQLPVLLVHGYVCNRGFMLPLRRYLGEHGVSAYSHNLEPVYADIDGYADGLARRVEEICAATGADWLVILAHSMGGLVARAYLRKHGARRVAKLITLGTPQTLPESRKCDIQGGEFSPALPIGVCAR